LPQEIATGLIRIVLDLSYERRGGLISILNDTKALKKLVPDHEIKGRVNELLRSFAAGLNITDKSHRRIIRSGAAIDGAIVLSQDGSVLDIACMIGEPSLEDCSAVGKSDLQRFAGARTTAAWNASIYGVAIKISEDGPVTIFKNGKVIFQFG
jgi:DNA integrity scanning protein DisA with diadenylate cyclase activity